MGLGTTRAGGVGGHLRRRCGLPVGFVREKLSLPRTLLVQLAASFAGFVTPPSVGGLAVNVRYLRKSGLPTSGAATSVALSQVVNAVVHAVLLIVFTAATGSASHPNLPIPSWVFIAVGGLAAIVAVCSPCRPPGAGSLREPSRRCGKRGPACSI